MDSTGDIKALASENIKLWQPVGGGEGSHYASSPCAWKMGIALTRASSGAIHH